MPAPKEVMTARVSVNTKKKLSEKADQIFVGLSSYIATVLDDHAESLIQDQYDQSHALLEHGNIISFFMSESPSTNASPTKKIAIIESAPLNLAFSHELSENVLIPILPMTSLINRRLFSHTRAKAKAFKGYIYYDAIDYFWIHKNKSAHSKPLKAEGFTSFQDAFRRFKTSKDMVLICGPLVSAFFTHSPDYIELQSIETPPVDIPLTSYLKVPFGESILETDIKQARTQWEQSSRQFLSLLDDCHNNNIESLKQYCQHTLPELTQSLGEISDKVYHTYAEFITALDIIFPNIETVRAYFGDESELGEVINQWVQYKP